MAATRPTTADFVEYNRLQEEAKKLRRMADACIAEAKPIEEKLAYAKAKGGKQKSVTTCGHVLAIVTKAGSVAWKAAFVKLAGKAKAEALIADAPSKEVLTIEAIR